MGKTAIDEFIGFGNSNKALAKDVNKIRFKSIDMACILVLEKQNRNLYLYLKMETKLHLSNCCLQTKVFSNHFTKIETIWLDRNEFGIYRFI